MNKCKWLDLAEELELCSSEKESSNIVRVLRSMLIRARIKNLFDEVLWGRNVCVE